MAWFEGFPFVSKEERERRDREFKKRLVPCGLEESREHLQAVLKELFPDLDTKDGMFAFYDAKDSYTKNDKGELGRIAAMKRLKRLKWIDDRKMYIFMALIELESEIDSLEDYPTKAQVLDRAYPEEVL